MNPRPIVTAAALAAGLLALAPPAAAHVTVSAAKAEQGGFSTFTLQVPNERDNAGTNRVEVTMPPDHPLAFVSVKPTPGWTATLERSPLAEPFEAFGEEVTESVSKITFEGGPLQPGQFEQFLVSAGPLPEDVDRLEFPAVQTYDNGDVQRWIEETPEGGEEPEFPAPVLELTSASTEGAQGDAAEESGAEPAAAGTDAATVETASGADLAAASSAGLEDDVDQARTFGIVGIVVGGLGLLTAGAALASRRRTAT